MSHANFSYIFLLTCLVSRHLLGIEVHDEKKSTAKIPDRSFLDTVGASKRSRANTLNLKSNLVRHAEIRNANFVHFKHSSSSSRHPGAANNKHAEEKNNTLETKPSLKRTIYRGRQQQHRRQNGAFNIPNLLPTGCLIGQFPSFTAHPSHGGRPCGRHTYYPAKKYPARK